MIKQNKIILILSIFGILILIFLSQTTPFQIGKIESIEKYNNKIVIKIENSTNKLILFETQQINLQRGDVIKFIGQEEIYKNQKQIIINKIIKCST